MTPADDADHAGLGHELADDPAARAADGALDADLAGSLGDAHGHRVDDREAADDEADDRDPDDDRVEDQGRAARPAARSRRRSSWSRWSDVASMRRASSSGVRTRRRDRRRSAWRASSRRAPRRSSAAAWRGTAPGPLQAAPSPSCRGRSGSAGGRRRRRTSRRAGRWCRRRRRPNSRAMSEPRTVTWAPSSAAVRRRPWAGVRR